MRSKIRRISFGVSLFVVMMIICGMIFSASATDNKELSADEKAAQLDSTMTALAGETEEEAPSNEDIAYAYVDGYADYVGTDENFGDNLQNALDIVRDSVSSYATFWSLVPPLIAIALALITKEVYSSLFLGIVSGALIYSGFNFEGTLTNVVDTMIGNLADSWNVGILIFLVILGIMVALVNKAGGAAAYGAWASKKFKTKRSASLATMLLGCLIFIDDYFNCLTVGSVMRPVTDKNKISRAKLAYLIDATAAPVCIIAPISSWAASVASVAPENEGLSLFIKSIPFNLYALLTIGMLIVISLADIDFGPMKKHELNAQNGDLFTTGESSANAVDNNEIPVGKGKVIDLILPVIVLIVCCVFGMVYTGGFFDGASFITAFADSDASRGLVLGSIIALIFTIIYYICRRVLSFKYIAEAIPNGFKAMVPAILILTFAWTLNSVTSQLGAKVFVAEFVRTSASGLQNFLPAIVFLIAIGLSFATGTSWGTFGILLPIVCSVFATNEEMMIISISACLAGAVCGDHCSPISDTTIMASAGAQCNHVNHVSTQLPYALYIAVVSFIGFIIAGFTKNVYITLGVSFAIMVAGLFAIKAITKKKA